MGAFLHLGVVGGGVGGMGKEYTFGQVQLRGRKLYLERRVLQFRKLTTFVRAKILSSRIH